MGNLHLVTGYAGKAHVMAADHGSLNAALFGSGQYVLNRGNKFAASIVTNNQIKVLDGDLMIQGRHVRLNEGAYVELTIENGEQGMLRNDLIVARYTKDSGTGVEDCNLVVIKGTAAESNPSDPEYTSADIIEGNAILADMPLYRVPLNGITIEDLVPLFSEANVGVSEEEIERWNSKADSDHKHDDRYYTETEVDALLAKQAPAYTYGTTDIEAGTSELATGTLHFVYE
jgi:hypothetical protein